MKGEGTGGPTTVTSPPAVKSEWQYGAAPPYSNTAAFRGQYETFCERQQRDGAGTRRSRYKTRRVRKLRQILTGVAEKRRWSLTVDGSVFYYLFGRTLMTSHHSALVFGTCSFLNFLDTNVVVVVVVFAKHFFWHFFSLHNGNIINVLIYVFIYFLTRIQSCFGIVSQDCWCGIYRASYRAEKKAR